jgi:hypothetical protein
MQTEVLVKKSRFHNFFQYFYSSPSQSSLQIAPYVFVDDDDDNNNNNNNNRHRYI